MTNGVLRVNCVCVNLTDRLNNHTSLSSAHTSRLRSSSESSWGTDWASHLSSSWTSIPEKKPRLQTRVGTEKKGSSKRHRKVGLSTWMETPNRMRILSEGQREFCLSSAPKRACADSSNFKQHAQKLRKHLWRRSPCISFMISLSSSPGFSKLSPTSGIQILQIEVSLWV